MKKSIKIIILLLTALTIVFFFFFSVNAVTDMKNLVAQANNGYGQKDDNTNSIAKSTRTIVGSIIVVVRIIAVGIAIIMIVVLAMKYMVSSVEDKAEIKKHATVYIVGAIVLFAASGLLGIIQQFANSINNSVK